MLTSLLFVAAFLSGLGAKYLLESRLEPGKYIFLTFLAKINKYAARLAGWYLIVHIGMLGGTEFAQLDSNQIASSVFPAVGVSVLIFVVSLSLLEITGFFERKINIAIATHFGSVSIGTFAASLALVEALRLTYSPVVFTWVSLMELPAVFLGVSLLGNGLHSVVDVIRKDKGLLLLPITIIVGAFLPSAVVENPGIVRTVLIDNFHLVLIYFLFDMGIHAYSSLSKMGTERWKIIGSGIAIPLVAGTLGAGIARVTTTWGMGDVVIFATLAASASYVAAPIALQSVVHRSSFSMSENPILASIGLTIAVGITLPFNIIFGIRIYAFEALLFSNTFIAAAIILVLILVLVIGVLLRQPGFIFSKRQHS